MAIKIRNFRPVSVFVNFGSTQRPVQFLAESPLPSEPKAGEPGRMAKLLGWFKRPKPNERRAEKPHTPAMTIALTQEALGVGADGKPLEDGMASFDDEEFAQYVELLREVSAEAVPRMNAVGDIPEREACVDDMLTDSSLHGSHARVLWLPDPKVALYYMVGFGDTFYDWATTHHPNTNLPAACHALYADIVVVVPRVCRMTPELHADLISAVGRRYRR